MAIKEWKPGEPGTEERQNTHIEKLPKPLIPMAAMVNMIIQTAKPYMGELNFEAFMIELDKRLSQLIITMEDSSKLH